MQAARPEQVWPRLAASERPFDRWFCQQLLRLLGIALPAVPPIDPVWTWYNRPFAQRIEQGENG